MASHIPQLRTISDFYRQLQIGTPQGDDFALMRIEDQPLSKRLEMPLFRCHFYRVVFFTNAGVAFQLPDQQFKSTVDSIYFSYPGKLESWTTHQKIHGYLVCFTETFAQIDSLHSSFGQTFPFFDFTAPSLLQLNEAQAKTLKTTTEQMMEEINLNHADGSVMLRHLLQRYLIQIRRIYQATEAHRSAKDRNSHHIFNQFKQAVDQHFVDLAEERRDDPPTVQGLAQKLHLNASYLNTSIKNLTGSTASAFLQKKMLLEAKSYLLHTDLQIAEVAFRLGFKNVPYFNRFFKKQSGFTPSAFRSSNT